MLPTRFANFCINANSKFAAGHAVNVLSNTSNEWYLTGLQLEVGSTATAFEHRSFGEELSLCQRYYYMHALGNGKSVGTGVLYQDNNLFPSIQFPVILRSTPTLDVSDGSDYFLAYSNGNSDGFSTFSALWNAHSTCTGLNAYSADGLSGRTAGHSAMIIANHASAKLGFSAEL